MIAAIYARKSSPQHGADAEAKSVTRQIENAKAFAQTKGFTVLDQFIFSDDNVKGADIKRQIGRQQLLNLIHSGRCPFGAVIVRDESRFSRRDGDVSFGELKQIAKAGVQVWFYNDGQPFKYGDYASNMAGFSKGEFAAEYRRQISRMVNEALVRKFKNGYVTGGRVFGYDNVKVNGHTERTINQAEAAVIVRIFKLYVAGHGYSRIAKQLNADGAPAPKPAQDRPAGWYHRTIGLALERELYRGLTVYGSQQSKDVEGNRIDRWRPRDQWLTAHRPDLQIVPDALWTAAHDRKAKQRELFKSPDGKQPGRRRDAESRYLLSGFARCSVCGGAIGVSKGFYTCLRNHLRGSLEGCASITKVKVVNVDDAVREALKKLLQQATIMLAVERAQKALSASSVSKELKRHQADLKVVDKKLASLTAAIEAGGQLEVLVKQLHTRQGEKDRLQATIMAMQAVDVASIQQHVSKKQLEQRLDYWHQLLAAVVEDARLALRRLLLGPLVMVPDGRRQFRFSGELQLAEVVAGDSPSNALSTSAQSKAWSLKFDGIAA